MTKAAATRIDETIAYIGRYTGLTPQLVRDVATFADDFIGRKMWKTQTYAVPGSSKPGSYSDFSNQMTMTDVNTPGTKDQRAMRRAIFLLRAAMGFPLSSAYAKAMLVAQVQQAFEDAMLHAACVAHQRIGKGDAPEYVYKRFLREDPLRFLWRSRVLVQGSGATHPTSNTNRLPFVFSYDAGRDRFVFGPRPRGDNPGGFVLDVSSVPAIPWHTAAGRGADAERGSFAAMHGTEFSEKCMVTTQLTGCSFCMQAAGGALYACHLKPEKGIDGTQLAQQLAGTVPHVTGAGFANAPASTNPVYVFGRGHGTFPKANGGYDARCSGAGVGSKTRYATVIGLQKKGAWRVYAQEIVDDEIVNVREIWP